MAFAILHVATRRGLSEILQPLCGAEISLHSGWGLGFQSETAGSVESSGVAAQEEELGGGSVRCRVGKEQDWGVETGSFLSLGGDPGAPQGAK